MFSLEESYAVWTDGEAWKKAMGGRELSTLDPQRLVRWRCPPTVAGAYSDGGADPEWSLSSPHPRLASHGLVARFPLPSARCFLRVDLCDYILSLLVLCSTILLCPLWIWWKIEKAKGEPKWYRFAKKLYGVAREHEDKPNVRSMDGFDAFLSSCVSYCYLKRERDVKQLIAQGCAALKVAYCVEYNA
jgi:hypothetical protein